MSLGTRSGVHWMRRKVRSSERATERASVVFPTPGTSSRRTWPSTRRAPRSCSVTSRFPTTTAATCSTRRSVALRTVRVTQELCGLQFRDGGAVPRWPTPDHARCDERDGEAHEGADGMQGEHDGILLAHRERREGALDEQDEGDTDERTQRDSPAVDRTRGDRQRDRGEDVDDPSGSVARRRPRPPAWHVAFVEPVGDKRERDRDYGVENPEQVRDLGQVVVFAGEPCRAPRVDAVQESVDDEEDRREQHQEDDRTERPCHPRPPSFPAESYSYTRPRSDSRCSIVSGGTNTPPRSTP